VTLSVEIDPNILENPDVVLQRGFESLPRPEREGSTLVK